MAVRIKIDQVARMDNGSVPGAGNASVQAWVRNEDGTNGAQAALWSAVTGGTSSLLARPCNADGTYPFWYPNQGAYNLVETVNGVVRPTITVGAVYGALEAFTSATMTNSWVAAAEPPQYTKTSEGLVIVRGHATHATGSALAAFTLPAGYRPATVVRFPHAGTSATSILVGGGGGVTFSASSTDVWFDNVRFVAL